MSPQPTVEDRTTPNLMRRFLSSSGRSKVLTCIMKGACLSRTDSMTMRDPSNVATSPQTQSTLRELVHARVQHTALEMRRLPTTKGTWPVAARRRSPIAAERRKFPAAAAARRRLYVPAARGRLPVPVARSRLQVAAARRRLPGDAAQRRYLSNQSSPWLSHSYIWSTVQGRELAVSWPELSGNAVSCFSPTLNVCRAVSWPKPSGNTGS